MDFVKEKKGFSIAEVIISLAVILIVSLSALTIVKASNISSLKTVSCAETRSYTETVLELYKFADIVEMGVVLFQPRIEMFLERLHVL